MEFPLSIRLLVSNSLHNHGGQKNHAHVTKQRIFNKFIEINFSVRCMVCLWCCLFHDLLPVHTASFWNIIIQWTSHDDLTEKWVLEKPPQSKFDGSRFFCQITKGSINYFLSNRKVQFWISVIWQLFFPIIMVSAVLLRRLNKLIFLSNHRGKSTE